MIYLVQILKLLFGKSGNNKAILFTYIQIIIYTIFIENLRSWGPWASYTCYLDGLFLDFKLARRLAEGFDTVARWFDSSICLAYACALREQNRHKRFCLSPSINDTGKCEVWLDHNESNTYVNHATSIL